MSTETIFTRYPPRRSPAAHPGAVLFDLDGTLIDSVPDISLAVAELMATENLPSFPEAEIRRMVGHGVGALVERAFASHGRVLDPADFETIMARMAAIYARHLTGRTTLMPGAVECLDALAAAGCQMALVTNKLQTAANTILEHFGIARHFAVVLGDDPGPDGLKLKPHPDMLLYALSRLNTSPCDAVMVGDSVSDVESATAASVFSVAVRNGYSSVPLETLKPDAIIGTLVDFSDAIAAWRNRG